MANKKSISNDLEMSVTDAVLKAYDNGTISPPAILAALMFSFPTLTLATIKSILRTHRKNKTPAQPKEEVKRPQTPIEQLENSIRSKCTLCEYHQSGRPCVMPAHLCPFPEMDEDCKRLRQLKVEAQKRKGIIKVPGGHITYTKKPRLSNIFDEVERELDEILGQQEAKNVFNENPYRAGGPIDSVLDDAIFVPEEIETTETFFNPRYDPNLPEELQKPEEDWNMEDFADVLSSTLMDG